MESLSVSKIKNFSKKLLAFHNSKVKMLLRIMIYHYLKNGLFFPSGVSWGVSKWLSCRSHLCGLGCGLGADILLANFGYLWY